jgi:uncharacterized protein (TIRG00374 family)
LINIVGSILLFAVLFLFVDVDNIRDSFYRMQMRNIYLACGLSALVLLIASVRWWVFVHAVGFPHGFWVSIRVRLVAQLLNLILPSGFVGDGLQVFLVSRRPRLSGPLALATILMDRIVALVAVLLLLLLSSSMLSEDMAKLVVGIFLSCSVGLGIAVGGFFILKRFNQASRLKGRLMSIIRFVTKTTRAIHNLKNSYLTLASTFSLATIGVFGNAAITWIFLSGLADVEFWKLIPTFCLVMLSSLIPATFSGMGVREWILFANLKSYGLSLEESVALSLTTFGIMVLVATVLSVFAGGVGLYRGESMSWFRSIFRKSNLIL